MKLQTIDVAGTPRQLGRATGEALRDRIPPFIEMRLTAVRGYMAERGYPDEWPKIFEVGEASFALFEDWDPEGHAEHCGIAEGAGVDPVRLFTAANMTDMRDAVLLSAERGEPLRRLPEEGCSSLIVPADRTTVGGPLVGQTWDLNPPDVEFIVAIRRRPTASPQTWSVTCTGCLTLMGLNEHGLSVGTTNIKTYGSRPGVGYLSILHRAIRAVDAEEALALVLSAPHAGAHTYWLADAHRQVEVEASPNAQIVRDASSGPLWRTNHCITETHQALEGEVPGDSSRARFARLEQLAGSAHGVDPETVIRWFSDRSHGVHSINRYPEDEQGTATNAVFVASPAQAKGWACRGPADRGEWVELSFD